MKVSVRTIQNTGFTVEVPDSGDSSTVAGLKKAIEKDRGEDLFPVAHTKLIYKGQVLQDSTTLADAGISETGFVVAMVRQPKSAKPASAAASSAPAATPAPAGDDPMGGGSDTANASAAAAAAPEAGQAPASASAAAAETLVSGEERERIVTELMSLGFDKEKVQQALQAAFNNPDRAADYLLNGIPASAAVQQQPQAPAQPAPQGGGAGDWRCHGASCLLCIECMFVTSFFSLFVSLFLHPCRPDRRCGAYSRRA